jgi:hypothetical protein
VEPRSPPARGAVMVRLAGDDRTFAHILEGPRCHPDELVFSIRSSAEFRPRRDENMRKPANRSGFLDIAPTSDALAGLRIVEQGVVAVDIIFGVEIVSIGGNAMPFERCPYLRSLISTSRSRFRL